MNAAAALIVSLAVMMALGVHTAVALGIASLLGLYLASGDVSAMLAVVGAVTDEGLRGYLFAAIPLFMLMGEFIVRSGAVTDIVKGIDRGLRRVPARLTVATIAGGALLSFATGASAFSAAAFSRMIDPRLERRGSGRVSALAAVAGASALGLLIPPGILMMVWAVVARRPLDDVFLAAIVPALLTGGLSCLYAVIATRTVAPVAARPVAADSAGPDARRVWVSALGLVAVLAVVLGGIGSGILSPTEAAGCGVVIALVLALLGGMRPTEMIDAVLAVGRAVVPILLVLLMAQLYAKALATTGAAAAIQQFVLGSTMGPLPILVGLVAIWLILGTLLDQVSAIVLSVALLEPIGVQLGYDPLLLAIVGIMALQAALLMPPFGMLPYTVKAAVGDDGVSVWDIFGSVTPYWAIMLVIIILIAAWPQMVTFLPGLVR